MMGTVCVAIFNLNDCSQFSNVVLFTPTSEKLAGLWLSSSSIPMMIFPPFELAKEHIVFNKFDFLVCLKC